MIRPINLGSSVDLPALMYSEEGFHFEVIKNNESGKPSTDEETLTNLRLTVKNQIHLRQFSLIGFLNYEV